MDYGNLIYNKIIFEVFEKVRCFENVWICWTCIFYFWCVLYYKLLILLRLSDSVYFLYIRLYLKDILGHVLKNVPEV